MITVSQIKAARAMLGLKQQELAAKAGISTGTLNNIERGVQTDPKLSTVQAIQRALENEGIDFTSHTQGALGISLRPSRTFGKNLPVLIIDDSDSDRLLYKKWLGMDPKRTFIPIEARNAREGYEAFVKHTPACILLDFMMYGKNGFQLLAEMKQDDKDMPPIIFITSMHSDEMEKEALALGARAYLNKNNLTQAQLCDAVDAALAR